MFATSMRGSVGSAGSRMAATRSRPQITHDQKPLPLPSSTLIAHSRAPCATPATPRPFSIAAAMPLTCVPWPKLGESDQLSGWLGSVQL